MSDETEQRLRAAARECARLRAELAAEREQHIEAIRKLTATVATLNADLASEWERVKVAEAGLDAAVCDTLKYRGEVAKLREALEAWQAWWELPWEAKRPDVAQLRYNRARAVLEETKGDGDE